MTSHSSFKENKENKSNTFLIFVFISKKGNNQNYMQGIK